MGEGFSMLTLTSSVLIDDYCSILYIQSMQCRYQFRPACMSHISKVNNIKATLSEYDQ